MPPWDKWVVQVLVSSILITVWTFRFNRSTPYRGKYARNMVEEFKVYGYSEITTYMIGAIKLLLALCLLAGLAFPELVKPTAGVLCLIMFWATVMQIKVEMNKPVKAAPAYFVFSLCAYLLLC